ncbi:MAG: UDP-N-acetyl glucosamine 2-epimerase, partial [Lentimicrobium sp.]|uniref:UDP-N-acetyl glucosamine 2-epimerase n=1 Tax=Lentimicrobium sp. TaxID=2034841 RepID=UPI0025F87D67
MIKIVTVIGARPQIIKAAALSRAIANGFADRITEIIVHTGQHYDENMSQVFFDELGIPKPDYNLGVGSGQHGVQTARMIQGIEEILSKEKPDMLVLYGDTNSTLAGAVAASKMHVPIAHIEAGLRSFNKSMPEEINRIMCDHASTLLFSPTATGFANLLREGFNATARPPFTIDNPKIYHCGDVMYDNSLHFAELAEQKSRILEGLGLETGNYLLSTIHRDNNTDIPERLNAIFEALDGISRRRQLHVVLPLHPRTSGLLSQNLSQQ